MNKKIKQALPQYKVTSCTKCELHPPSLKPIRREGSKGHVNTEWSYVLFIQTNIDLMSQALRLHTTYRSPSN